MGILTKEIMPALQGVFPVTIATCSSEGEPNITCISQVYYVDEDHVALSNQFFNKTARNIQENPKASVQVIHPLTGEDWRLEVVYDHSETEGPVFEEMEIQLEAIASDQGMEDVFQLKAADIYQVVSIERLNR